MSNTTLNLKQYQTKQQQVKVMKLRFDTFAKHWEVYTSLLGSKGPDRWIILSDADAHWYMNNFTVTIEEKPTSD